jgi:hypothetical protein
MTDSNSIETAQADNQEDAEPAIFELPGDWFLRTMVETIVGMGVEIGVTLSVGGAVVSGVAINGQQYMDLFADQFTGGTPEGDVRNTLGEALRGWKRVYEKPADAGEDWKPPRTGYIHLKNARYHAPGYEGIPSSGVLWRGRLEAVDGFSLGNFKLD